MSAKQPDERSAPKSAVSGFHAEEPEKLTTRRPEQRGTNTAEEWRAVHWPRQAAHRATLPVHLDGKVGLEVIGGKVCLAPSDQDAAIALDGLRTQLGVNWDDKRRADLAKLDEATRRGVSGFDSLVALARMGGLDLAIDERAEHNIAAYRRHLRLQRLPIPRTIWVDEAERGDAASIEEIDLVSQSHRAGR
jgi:hypothetical protein